MKAEQETKWKTSPQVIGIARVKITIFNFRSRNFNDLAENIRKTNVKHSNSLPNDWKHNGGPQ